MNRVEFIDELKKKLRKLPYDEIKEAIDYYEAYFDDAGPENEQNVKEILNVSESTLYPVLRRLQRDGYLTTYDVPYDGRNRRYYQITNPGKAKLSEYLEQWDEYKEKVDKILSGGTADEQS